MKRKLREKTIAKISAGLSVPRVQISIILFLTSMAAFLASVILLRFGLTSMSLRYSIAAVLGYVVFLFLLWLWILIQKTKHSDLSLGDLVPDSITDLSLLDGTGSGSLADKDFSFGGGGDFAGAGAGGDWSETDVSVRAPVAFASKPSAPTLSASSGSSGSWFGSFDLDFDLDDGLALVLVVIIAALIMGALIYIIWIAPVLLAELVIDTAVVTSFYKPVKNIERNHWLKTALWKTGIPAMIILLLSFGAGFIMELAVPEAVTVGQFVEAAI